MEPSSKTAIFVRGVPRSATSKELEIFFGEIGPLRACFVVTDKDDSSRNRGYGFVQFAVAEDAERALQLLSSVKFMNTKLSMEFAKHRHRSATGKLPEVAESVVAVDATKGRTRIKPTWKRVVMISGFGEEVDRKKIYKKVIKFGHVCSMIYPALVSAHSSHIDLPDRLLKIFNNCRKNAESGTANEALDDQESDDSSLITMKGIAHVLYLNEEQAQTACMRLNNHIFKGSRMTAAICPNPADAKQSSRLLVRNIPFNCRSDQLFEIFRQYGFLLEINIPLKSSGNEGRGFAFITLSSRQEAESALNGVNGTKPDSFYGRTIIVDWALSKENYLAQKHADDSERVCVAQSNPIVNSPDSGDGPKTEDTTAGCASQELDLSVIDDGPSEINEFSNGGLEQASVVTESTCDQEDPRDDYCDEDDEVSVEFENDTTIVNEQTKMHQSDVHLGTTLFIRNISFESTEKELLELFKSYGSVKYCKITMDRETGKPKGTGFIQFFDKSDAEKVLKMTENSQASIGATMIVDQKNSLLRPESSCGFWLHGRQLFIMAAMERKEAEEKKQTDQDVSKQKDKRNTYLLKEGFIRSDSQAAKDLPPKELNIRQQSYFNRKRQLERFPHLFVSKTRLSIRNLPKSLDKTQLKHLTKTAAIEYRSSLRAQSEQGTLGKSEKQELRRLVDEEHFMDSVFVTQSKVILDPTKMTGDKQPVNASKGYGFVEFTRHSHALACLRQLNNNPSALPDGRRLLVEFAIENSQILKKREGRVTAGGASTNRPIQKSNKNVIHSDIKMMTAANSQTKPVDRVVGKEIKKPRAKSPEAKPPKRKRSEVVDEFDSMVSRYKHRLTGTSRSPSSGEKSRWFE